MLKRALLIVAAVCLLTSIGGGVWVRQQLRASLPQLEGDRQVGGLSAPVEIARDGLGIPTIHGATRADVARATGFLHAQDRFFQMDLQRRRAAGELAELVGGRAADADREIRIHRFRAIARRAVDLLAPGDRAVLGAYVAGVNTGLQALGARPFEYFLLRQDPRPWREEDSLLVVLSMFATLQDADGSYESTVGTMHDLLPKEMFDFLTPRGTEWDSPIVGEGFSTPPIPSAQVYDLRARRGGKPTLIFSARAPVEIGDPGSGPSGSGATSAWPGTRARADREAGAVGSNNFAVAGRLTGNGGAIVANDMHLAIRVPNTWYRAAFEWPDTRAAGENHRVIGVTLPGVPAMVVGSNTRVAWGFTNTYGDWGDLVVLEIDPADAHRYRTPDGFRPFDAYDEVIHVAGEPDQRTHIDWTIWGPVLGPDHLGRLRAYRWVAHSAEMLAATVTPLEAAGTIEEAFDEANGAGAPGQNVVVADRTGRIGWTVYGSIPRRVGLDGALPLSWADGARGWRGWRDDREYPRVADPPGGRLWTANARVVDGDGLAAIGDGSFEVGSRARIIRDRLLAREQFTPKVLLDIQLDTSAEFLKRWRDLALRTLTPQAIAGDPQRARFRDIVEHDWSGHAVPESAGYRLTRAFRERTSQWVFAFVLAECYEADDRFDYTAERKREGPLWRMVTGQPLHLLDPRFQSWDAMLVAAIDRVIADTTRRWPGDLAKRTWAEANVTAYQHPLSAALPFVGRWLDMPPRAVPGDLYTPRVAWGPTGASERMVVSPGHEQDGIMEMPTGQSGHPLSPHYSDSHEAWVRGDPTPFLPGATIHVLRLAP